MKAALIGAGNIGGVHSEAYKMIEDINLAAVVDNVPEKAKAIAAIHGARAYSTVDEMLENEAPDFVDICTPTFTHEEICLKAMEKKIHVLCEKPLALDEQSARNIVEASEKHDVIFMVAQVIRFWPEYQYLKEICDSGRYGKVLYAQFLRKGQAPTDSWFADPTKSGGGVLDLMIHDADFILHLLGEPDLVESESVLFASSHDYIRMRYSYGSNLLVDVEGGWIDYPTPFEMSYRVVFERAILEYKNDKIVMYPHGGRSSKTIVLEEMKNVIGLSKDAPSDGYYNEIRYFADCVKYGKKPEKVPPAQSLSCLKLVLEQLASRKKSLSV
jgi:UDP-N-acetylglucosamine 3-dehydrogenase